MDLAPPLGRPSIENFPSGLRKITRLRKLDPAAAKAGAIEASAFAPYGTADVEFTTALLIDQRIERRSEAGASATLVQVFQELGDNVLTATTEVVETTTFDGRRVTRRLYLCKASQYAFLRPIIGSGAPSVFQVEVEIVGPVAKVTTFDIAITDLGFVYSQSDETKDNGKLLLRTIRTLAQIAATPGGYTLVGSSTQETDGYTVYTANFAKGEGQISYNTSSRYNGMLQTVTIQYLTAASVSTQPTTDPLGGGILVDSGYNEQDGYRVWTAAWRKAVGTSLIRDDVEIKYGGKLVIYRRSRFNEAPGVPGGTIGGTVVEISRGTQLEDGFTIYNATWAEGNGRISLETETKNNGALVVSTVRYFKADDGGGVADGTLVSTGISKQDGIDLTTEVYAEGDGEISRDVDTLLGGLVTRTTIRHLTAPTVGSQPTTNPGSAFITGEARSDQDGYRVWTVTWAKGVGTVSTDITAREDGSRVYDVVSLSAESEVPDYSGGGSGYLVHQSNEEKEGYWVNRVRYIKPPATVTLKKIKDFHMPGLASFDGSQLIISPPSVRTILADEEVSYGESQLETVPFKVDFGAFYRANYIRANNNDVGESEQKALGYILAGASGINGTDSAFNGMLCTTWSATLNSSSPVSRPSGLTVIDADNQIYLAAIDGTIVYRRVSVSYNF